jgi:predicted RNase H-like HicB family nuclease
MARGRLGGDIGMSMKQYTVVYERAGSNYSAYVPDLPGIIAAANTVEETEGLIQEAIGIYLAILRSEGRAIPEPSTSARLVAVAA